MTEDSEEKVVRNFAWLQEHEQDEEYRGHWVALRNGELVGFDKSRVTLQRTLEERGTLEGLLFVRLCEPF